MLDRRANFEHFVSRMTHAYRRKAFETEVRRGFSQARPTQAYPRYGEEAEREKPRRMRVSDAAIGMHEWSWLQIPPIQHDAAQGVKNNDEKNALHHAQGGVPSHIIHAATNLEALITSDHRNDDSKKRRLADAD